MIRSKLLAGIAAAAGFCMYGSTAGATLLLPNPSGSIDGLPVVELADQAVIYSAKLLDQWQQANLLPSPFNTVNYQFSTGTGTIPVIVYTGANGATNPSPFENPLEACGGGPCTSFSGTWGLGNTTTQFAGTVGALKTLLGSNIPVFYFDHNEGGGGTNAVPNLRASGRVAIYNGLTLVKQWSIDAINNGLFDPTAFITSCDSFTIGGGGAGSPPCDFGGTSTSGTEYTVDNNGGSGKPDYFLLANGLNLDDYDPNFKFVVEMNLEDLNGGFEELGLTGGQFLITQVPEPSTMATIGFGLLTIGGIFWLRRRDA
jgi:hypothetical protein